MVFKLIFSKKRVRLRPLTSIDIPFSFAPKAITSYHCEIILEKDDELSWIFPIKGETEYVSDEVDNVVVTRCREEVTKKIKYKLVGLKEFFFDKD